MASLNDPKGYYARLGVKPGVSARELKRAFRRRAKELHPDRNPGKDTNQAFTDLQEAYDVLKDVHARAKYDSAEIEQEHYTREYRYRQMDPIVCSDCGSITAQPRYAIFYEVKSLILTVRSARQGVFCSICAAKAATKASAITWLFGWWSIFWGPIYSIHAVISNLFGGEVPKEHNARMLAYQAAYFATTGKNPTLARAVAMEALTLAINLKPPFEPFNKKKRKETEAARALLVSQINRLLSELDDGQPIKRLTSKWGMTSRMVMQQAAIAVLVFGSSALAIGLHNSRPASQASSQLPQTSTVAKPAVALQAPQHRNSITSPTKAILTPVLAPKLVSAVPRPLPLPRSGRLMSNLSAISGLPRPPLKIETDRNGPNWLIKLSELSDRQMLIFVRSGETVNVKVPEGIYTVRFATGYDWYGLKRQATSGYDYFGPGTDYTTMDQPLEFWAIGDRLEGHELTLFAVPNGNLRRTKIDAEQF